MTKTNAVEIHSFRRLASRKILHLRRCSRRDVRSLDPHRDDPLSSERGFEFDVRLQIANNGSNYWGGESAFALVDDLACCYDSYDVGILREDIHFMEQVIHENFVV
jgi:hypothetical protein